jgi:hypothetical protein
MNPYSRRINAVEQGSRSMAIEHITPLTDIERDASWRAFEHSHGARCHEPASHGGT